LPIPEERMKNEKQWRLVTVNGTYRMDELLKEMDNAC
jgi:hypothetical protein